MKEMNRYQVVYTIATIVHAEDEKDALDVAAELDMNEDNFVFVDAEVEYLDCEEDYNDEY